MIDEDIAADELNDDIELVLDMGLLRSENGALVPANPMYAEIIGRYLSFNTQERMKRVVPETPFRCNREMFTFRRRFCYNMRRGRNSKGWQTMGKIATFGEKARKLVSGLKFNYLNEDDSSLGKVDFGVLTRRASRRIWRRRRRPAGWLVPRRWPSAK